MSRQEKIQALLDANKAQYKTFEERAKNARLILLADDLGLEFIADAVGVKF